MRCWHEYRIGGKKGVEIYTKLTGFTNLKYA